MTTGDLPPMFQPLHDRVLIKRIAADEKIGSIIVPEQAREKPVEGIVIAAGPGRRLENGTVVPMAVKHGDRVLFGKYSGNEIKIEGAEHTVLREDDILGIVG